MKHDLMFRDEIESIVARAYRELENPQGPAMGLYDPEQHSGLPESVQSWALWVGNPLRHAGLQPGETVLDLGSGSGIDVLVAARQVGEAGKAIGIDMLPEMVERSELFAEEAGISNVEFILGRMDDIPLEDGSVDVIISNGSINLAARKSRVFAEAQRVLRKGGRFCVSDLTIDEEDLPTEILTHPSAWAG
ncbi:MAG: methyltransferase domain-containing protein [Acidimicrobiia bacterium]